MKDLSILLKRHGFLYLQLVVCLICIYGFVKINYSINLAVTTIKNESGRLVSLQNTLVNIQSQIKGFDSTQQNEKHSDNSKEDQIAIADSNRVPETARDHIRKDTAKVWIDVHQKKGLQVQDNSAKNLIEKDPSRTLIYQRDLRGRALVLNSSESIVLATAFFNLSTPGNSRFSLQEVYKIEEGSQDSRMIYFNCVRANINRDSTIDFRFTEQLKLGLNELDPLNYNKELGVSITGKINSAFLNCVLLWKEISGQPHSIGFKLPITGKSLVAR